VLTHTEHQIVVQLSLSFQVLQYDVASYEYYKRETCNLSEDILTIFIFIFLQVV